MREILPVILIILLIAGVSQGAYINNESLNQGNNIYLTLMNTTFDNLTCCSSNTLSLNVSGSALTFTVGANKSITNSSFSNDNFTFTVSGTAGYINFSSTMINASNSYNLTANGAFVESRNTSAAKSVWFNYTGDATLSVTWNASVPSEEPPIVNGTPTITSYSPADLTPTIDVNALATFNAGANQSVQWTWTGATEGAGDGSANSTATQTWTTTGAKTVTVTCSNANGSCGTIQWDVDVVSDGSGGGTDWDYLTGTVAPTGSTIAINPAVSGSPTTGGAYTFGYVFVDGQTYWVNVSKAGYTSNNTQITFNEDHEIWNPILTLIPDSTLAITAYSPATPTTVRTGDDLTFEVTGSTGGITAYHWVQDGVGVGDTSAIYTNTFNYNNSKKSQLHSVTVYGTNGSEMSNTIEWSVTVLLTAIKDYDFDKNFSDIGTSELNPVNLSRIGASPYVSGIFGSVFWGIIFALIFIMIWSRQKDVTIPSILGLIIGLSLWSFMPADWVSMASSLSIISFFGIMYTLIKGRR